MATTRLKLNGKPLELRPARPTETQISNFLDNAPADELYLAQDLAKKAHVGSSSLTPSSWCGDLLRRYSARIGKLRYWGNPKAIAELLKQVAQ
jgi:hypothetical protein